jgi:hypothetical protein
LKLSMDKNRSILTRLFYYSITDKVYHTLEKITIFLTLFVYYGCRKSYLIKRWWHIFDSKAYLVNFYSVSAVYSQNRMKSFLAPITLRLFHFNGLARWFHFDAIKMQMKAAHFVNSFCGPHKLRVALELCMARDLYDKMNSFKNVKQQQLRLQNASIVGLFTWKWFFFWHTNASSTLEKLKPLSASTR